MLEGAVVGLLPGTLLPCISVWVVMPECRVQQYLNNSMYDFSMAYSSEHVPSQHTNQMIKAPHEIMNDDTAVNIVICVVSPPISIL
jgi:hypothetical protein